MLCVVGIAGNKFCCVSGNCREQIFLCVVGIVRDR